MTTVEIEAQETERPGLRSALRSPDVRLLMSAQLVSSLGDVAAQVALMIAVYATTRSAAASAFAGLAALLPRLGAGQWIAARLAGKPGRSCVVAADLLRGAGYLAAAYTGNIVLLLGLVVAVNLITPVADGSVKAMLLEALPPKDAPQGLAALQLTAQVALLCGYAGGGYLATTVGPRDVLLLNAASFVASAMLLSRLAVGRTATHIATRAHALLGQVARLMWADPTTRRVLLITLAGTVGAMSVEVLVAPLAAAAHDPGSAGVLVASVPAGTILATLAQRKADTTPAGLVLLFTLAGAIPAATVLLLWPHGPAVLTAIAFAAAGVMFAAVAPFAAVAVPRIDGPLRSTAVTILQGLLVAAQATGGLVAGLLVPTLGPARSCALLLVVAVVVAARLRSARVLASSPVTG